MNNLNELGLVEMRQEEMIDLDGGFFPVVIAGVHLSSKLVAGIIIGAGVAGAATGAYLASQE